MNRDNEDCILFFVKYPVPNRAKTRLTKQIGIDDAINLYKNFVTDILATLKGIDVNIKIAFTPADSKKQFQKWLGKEYSYIPQIGQNLGQRMKNAFIQTFEEGFDRVVVIGSDSPDLPKEYIELAFAALNRKDIVIGPSSDGGYYLIGFTKNSFLSDVFEKIDWGSNKVFNQTVSILKQHRQGSYLLPQWHDIDTFMDLRSFFQRNKDSVFLKSATMQYLLEHDLGNKSNVRL